MCSTTFLVLLLSFSYNLITGIKLETRKHCCELGTEYASNKFQCKTFLPEMAGVELANERSCLSMVDVCCKQKYRELQCEEGISTAKKRIPCLDDENSKECCEACQAGIEAGENKDPCIGFGVDERSDGIFKNCCEEVETSTTTESTTVLTTVSSPKTENPPPLPNPVAYNSPNANSANENICDSDVCAQICEPLENGGYRCDCFKGYALMEDQISCRLVKKKKGTRCEIENPCDHDCTDTGTAIKCSCRDGYKLTDDNRTCADIDECETGIHDCANKEDCINEVGGYSCYEPVFGTGNDSLDFDNKCPAGYKFDFDKLVCDDIDECKFDLMCVHPKVCKNTIGSFSCEGDDTPKCPKGFHFKVATQNCDDVDECLTGENNCNKESQVCLNTKGNYTCVDKASRNMCPPGFKKNPATQNCEDINECEDPDVCGDNETCVNESGGHTCVPNSVKKTFSTLSPPPIITPFIITTIPTKRTVSCPQGYAYSDEQDDCLDINECQMDKHTCKPFERCDNTVGSYACTRITGCGTGYTLNMANGLCEDDNECELNTNNCAALGPEYVCRNIRGSYRCDFDRNNKNLHKNIPAIERSSTVTTRTYPNQTQYTSTTPKSTQTQYSSTTLRPPQTQYTFTTPAHVTASSNRYDPYSRVTTPPYFPATPNLPVYVPPNRESPPSRYFPAQHYPQHVIPSTPETPLYIPVHKIPQFNPEPPSSNVPPPSVVYVPSSTKSEVESPPHYIPSRPSSRLPVDSRSPFAGYSPSIFRQNVPSYRPESPENNNVVPPRVHNYPVISGQLKKCLPGYKMNPRGECEDVDECLDNPCEKHQRCLNFNGRYDCTIPKQCKVGFELNDSGDKCVDVNECARGTHKCNPTQICKNYQGYYTCECPPGHHLNNRSQKCEDLDECRVFRACGSNAVCINTKGSFKCQCKEGFRKNNNICDDVDECKETIGLCEHNCINTWGGHRCSCNAGFTLNNDNRTCTDINECERFKDRRLCIGTCKNVPGSYKCECPKGYKLGSDGRVCIDIDECQHDVCNPGDVCLNTRGSYKCFKIECPKNYIKDTEHQSRCKRLKSACDIRDYPCLSPEQYTYQFITIVSNLPLPGSVQLFQIRGPIWADTRAEFSMKLLKVDCPDHVRRVDESYFQRTSNQFNSMALLLVKPVEGPQEIRLEVQMKMFQNNVMFGNVIVNIVIVVSEYTF